MKETENRGRVPRLRFPEFREAEEWRVGKVEDMIFTVTPPKKLLKTEYLSEGQFPVIDQSQKELYGWTNDAEALINDEYPLVIFGDHTCILKIMRQPFSQGADGIKIFRATSLLVTEYLYQCLQFNPVVMEEYKRHFAILRNKTISYPSWHAEQQKIADCLTSLDDLITLESQKLNSLKAHKKGLMQQLFPAEGETVPRLRFPEFRDAREWEEKCIRDLGEIVTGSTPSTTKSEFYGGDRPFVSPADISDQRFIGKTKTTLTEIGFGETRPIKAESILFVCIGSTIGKIAQNLYECATNQQINSVIPDSEHENAFVYYSLECSSEKISGLAGNHAVPIINKTAFGSVEIIFPKLPEQQKIADCLSSLDELITAQAQKVGALKTHKKGLMQQLFPVLDDTPG